MCAMPRQLPTAASLQRKSREDTARKQDLERSWNSPIRWRMKESSTIDEQIKRAAAALREADALLVCAGAGMGVDSGLPDFRGTEGFWRAYPVIAKLGLSFEEMANPAWFQTDPRDSTPTCEPSYRSDNGVLAAAREWPRVTETMFLWPQERSEWARFN